MVDPTTVATVLLAFISILVSIIAGVLSYMLYYFIPMKQKVNTLWNDWFGIPNTGDEGRMSVFEERHEDAKKNRKNTREVIEETREEQNEAHQDVQNAFGDVFQYLNRLALELRSQGVEVPKPDDEIDGRVSDERSDE